MKALHGETTSVREAFESLRGLNVYDAARALGLSRLGRNGISPCPACGAERRHTKSKDKRGAIGVRTDGLGWVCWQCEKRGDAIRLISYACGLNGNASGSAAVAIADRAQSLGLIGHARKRFTPRIEAPVYPDEGQLRGLMRETWHIMTPGAELAAEWVRSRGLDPAEVAETCSCAFIPDGATLPAWAAIGGASWLSSGHRLLIPLYDGDGIMRSVRARDITGQNERKEIAPQGCAVRGLVMADRFALRLLREEAGMAERALANGVWVAEGTPDFLTSQVREHRRGDAARPVFSVSSGGWSRTHADHIPDGATVTIATHNDAAGDGYAQAIVDSLSGRCTVRRYVGGRK